MDTHNYLIAAWYVYQFLAMCYVVARGRHVHTLNSQLVSIGVYVLLVLSIFTTGDPGSWQAVTLMFWWALNSIYGFKIVGKVERFNEVSKPVYLLLTLIISGAFLWLGINVPVGG